jgi:predicted amidohydrolase
MQLRITTVQSDILWHRKAENLKRYSKLLERIEPNSTDLVILPEMFTTGFTMSPKLVKEKFEDNTFFWMEEQANRLNATIMGSFVCKYKRDYFNRLLWMQPGRKYADYDKRHLFAHAGEDKHYTAGTKLLNVTWLDWEICPLICYDLRFPVWSRNFKLAGMIPSYDVLIYIANWPASRKHAWKTLLIARAIENQSYVVGVNRIGVDGNGIEYSGDTMVVDYSGTVLYCKSEECEVKTHTLDYENLLEFRSQFRFLDDQDIYKFVESSYKF